LGEYFKAPNLEIEIHDFASSSHPWASRKIIAEPTGATQILRKAHKYEHNANSKNPISRFGKAIGLDKRGQFGFRKMNPTDS